VSQKTSIEEEEAHQEDGKREEGHKFKMKSKSSVALKQKNVYMLPCRFIRNRINSESLNSFMNYQEIEKIAKKLRHDKNSRQE